MNARRERILFLNRSYWPDAEATGQLLTELCEDLAQQFDVTVVAGQPNQNPKNETFVQNGSDVHNGVTIERVGHPQFSKRSMFGRAINLIGFLLAATLRVLRVKRPDIVVVETDPFLLPLLGRWLKWWHGARFVVYLQDLYPDVAVALDKVQEGWLTRLLRWQLCQAYRQADKIIVLSGDMRDRLIQWRLSGRQIVCVENWVDTSSVFPVKNENTVRSRLSLDDQFIVMHSGNMGLTQYLGNVIEAANHLADRTDIEILLVGDGATRRDLEHQAAELKLKNVRFLPYQPRNELAQSLSAADVHLISMHPLAHHCLMPSKLYGILASGTAVVVIAAVDSELSRLVVEWQVGLAVPPNDPIALSKKLRWCAENRELLRDMGQRARQLAVDLFDRKRQTARFAEVLKDTCEPDLMVAATTACHQTPIIDSTAGTPLDSNREGALST